MGKKQQTIGILGAGKLGMVLARLAITAGYRVQVAGSGNASKIALSVSVIAPGATAATSEEVIKRSDFIILALPLRNYINLSIESLSGKLVIDAMNYWWEVDGDMPELSAAVSSSQMVQEHLRGAHIVKALSHMGYHNLFDDARPLGSDERRAIAVAGDDPTDVAVVSSLVNDFGFDPVNIGNLAAGKTLEPGNELFGASVTSENIRAVLDL